eukprot:TRINITY_DN481_c2_g1_i1.p1 TRINITY_DN481_c2_g1~~TRINITY_DN481_c2_g1_i1.p1  ORF type:complete len:535 (+),score=114.67 TRINITY_DN481_c2_g1_i1:106-1710(+)
MGSCLSSPRDTHTIDNLFTALVNESDAFFCPFPVQTNRWKNIAGRDREKREAILNHVKYTNILVNHKTIPIVSEFLKCKRKYGSDLEKNLYENMTVRDFIERTIKARPLCFYSHRDVTKLRDGSKPQGSDWALVGTDNEGSISLKDYMSFDEIQISSLFGISSPTYFINEGDRNNRGIPNTTGDFEEFGIYVGLVGTRFEHLHLMESQFILVTEQHSTPENGYGKKGEDGQERSKLEIWAKALGSVDQDGDYYFPSYSEVKKLFADDDKTASSSFHKFPLYGKEVYFNINVYKERVKLPIQMFLIDANYRATKLGKKAYVHTVGLGLGSWQVCNSQAKWMVEVYADLLESLKLPNIGVLDFSWFPPEIKTCGKTKHQEIFSSKNGNAIKIYFSKRNPADKINEDEEMVLVACYPWDGNSFPGNEYWNDLLMASGDPAAACCSTISEIQNPYINKALLDKIFVTDDEGGSGDDLEKYDLKRSVSSDGESKKTNNKEEGDDNEGDDADDDEDSEELKDIKDKEESAESKTDNNESE